MSKFNRDKMSNAAPLEVGKAAMSVLTSLQKYPSEVQVAGSAVVLKELIDLFELSPSDVLGIAGRIIYEEDHRRPELRAVGSYLREELE